MQVMLTAYGTHIYNMILTRKTRRGEQKYCSYRRLAVSAIQAMFVYKQRKTLTNLCQGQLKISRENAKLPRKPCNRKIKNSPKTFSGVTRHQNHSAIQGLQPVICTMDGFHRQFLVLRMLYIRFCKTNYVSVSPLAQRPVTASFQAPTIGCH